MSFITKWLTQCSDCFNRINSSNEHPSQLSEYYINIHNLAKNCLHISNRKDFICYKCFRNFFGYDRFIIRHLFFYLNQKQTDYIDIKQFYLFAERIINWHEFINHIDFILQLFHIILNINMKFNEYSLINLGDLLENNSINSILLYELINDAFFFTAIQSNAQTNLTNQSQVSCRYIQKQDQEHRPRSRSESQRRSEFSALRRSISILVLVSI